MIAPHLDGRVGRVGVENNADDVRHEAPRDGREEAVAPDAHSSARRKQPTETEIAVCRCCECCRVRRRKDMLSETPCHSLASQAPPQRSKLSRSCHMLFTYFPRRLNTSIMLMLCTHLDSRATAHMHDRALKVSDGSPAILESRDKNRTLHVEGAPFEAQKWPGRTSTPPPGLRRRPNQIKAGNIKGMRRAHASRIIGWGVNRNVEFLHTIRGLRGLSRLAQHSVPSTIT